VLRLYVASVICLHQTTNAHGKMQTQQSGCVREGIGKDGTHENTRGGGCGYWPEIFGRMMEKLLE
jgi:hypothetical protein